MLRPGKTISGDYMARWTDRRAQFRAVLNGDACVSPASVYDPMSARLARQIGYETGILAGSTASMTVLGAPDHIVLTLSEFADQAGRIGRATDLPLLVDADHGYGNALNVMRTVEELEVAGVAALSIEDTDLPAPFASGGKASLISLEEGIGKMKAAMAAKPDPDLVVCGRTSAAQIAGAEECRRRVAAYTEVGVDAIFLVGVPDRDCLDIVSGATDLPIVLGGAGPELKDPDYLASRNVRIRLTGHQPIAAAMNAAYETLLALRNGTRPSDLAGLPSKDRIAAALDDDRYAGHIRDFLNG